MLKRKTLLLSAVITAGLLAGCGGGSGKPSKTNPTISSINDVTLLANMDSDNIQFLVGDKDTLPADIVITASSSNPRIITNEGLIVTANGATRNLIVSPLSDEIGTATITVTAIDGDLNSSSTTFVVNVIPEDVPATSFVNDVFANPENGEPVKINGISLIQDTDDTAAFDNLL